MARGSLRIYLGAAPGVGKTYKMLGEGVRRTERGTDVVIGIVETHGRSQTAEQMHGLEVIPRREVHVPRHGAPRDGRRRDPRRGGPRSCSSTSTPTPTRPARRNEKRWQDVEQLLDAGIEVISTLNIQHLESLNDVITRITGTVQRETVPDDIVRRADQLELVDMAPEAIRRRMAHGNIYPAERVDAALANYFRPGNLGALRELALLWVADRVEESLTGYLDAHGISEPWETRERVVVGLTGVAGGDALIRRAARMAGRVGGELIGVHVAVDDGLVATERRRPRRATQTRHRTRRHRPRRRRPGHRRSDGRVRPPGEGHPTRARREPAQPLARARPRVVRRTGHPPRARHRRARHRPNRHRRTGTVAPRRRRTASSAGARPSGGCSWSSACRCSSPSPCRSATRSICRRNCCSRSSSCWPSPRSADCSSGSSPRSSHRCSSTGSSSSRTDTLTIGRTENLISLVVFIVVAVAVGALVDLRHAALPRRAPRPPRGRSTGPIDDQPRRRPRTDPATRRTDPLDVRPRRRPARRRADRGGDDAVVLAADGEHLRGSRP